MQKKLTNQIKQHIKKIIYHGQVVFIPGLQRWYTICNLTKIIHRISITGWKPYDQLSGLRRRKEAQDKPTHLQSSNSLQNLQKALIGESTECSINISKESGCPQVEDWSLTLSSPCTKINSKHTKSQYPFMIKNPGQIRYTRIPLQYNQEYIWQTHSLIYTECGESWKHFPLRSGTQSKNIHSHHSYWTEYWKFWLE